MTDLSPHIAVYSSARHSIIIEQYEVMKNIETFSEAVCLFFGYIYIFSLKYNSRYTYELVQKVIMNIDTNKVSPKIMNMMSKLK